MIGSKTLEMSLLKIKQKSIFNKPVNTKYKNYPIHRTLKKADELEKGRR